MSEDDDFETLIEPARKLFAGPVSFLKSAPDLRFLPDPVAPEVAFAGRSNVGKSSLLNRLTNRVGLARTSNTPGRTQELNFFDVGAPEEGGTPVLRLVDMPGYGFAKAPKDIVRKWRHVVNDYLRGRVVLRRALVLIDSRHGIKDVDREIMEMLDKAAVTYHIVLTKADKIKASELAKVTELTEAEARKHVAAHPRLLVTSSEKDMGMAELRAAIVDAIR
jgi:GTP-binding protein